MNANIYFPKCGVCGRNNSLIRIAKDMGGSIIGKEEIICQDCLLKLREKLGKKDHKEIEKFFSGPYQICSQHNQWKNMFTKDKEGKWREYCFFCEEEKWVNSLQRFDINPFSLAKYFYERGIEDIAIIQKLIYLTYLEVLEEENILLDFGEDFQAWDGGPVVESVFSAMLKDWEKYGNYEETFRKIPILKEEKIIKHCEKWVKNFKKIEKKKQHYKISWASQNQPWMIARNKVSNFLDHEKIEVNDIINFVKDGNGSKGEQLRSLII